MARGTRRRRPQPKRRKPKHNWTNKLTRESRQRDKFLDKGKENYFRYDLEDILRAAEVPADQWSGFISTLFAKGTRLGLEEAQEFAEEKREEGLYDEETHEKVLRLLGNFATWR
jgi:hypothetical protein